MLEESSDIDFQLGAILYPLSLLSTPSFIALLISNYLHFSPTLSPAHFNHSPMHITLQIPSNSSFSTFFRHLDGILPIDHTIHVMLVRLIFTHSLVFREEMPIINFESNILPLMTPTTSS